MSFLQKLIDKIGLENTLIKQLLYSEAYPDTSKLVSVDKMDRNGQFSDVLIDPDLLSPALSASGMVAKEALSINSRHAIPQELLSAIDPLDTAPRSAESFLKLKSELNQDYKQAMKSFKKPEAVKESISESPAVSGLFDKLKDVSEKAAENKTAIAIGAAAVVTLGAVIYSKVQKSKAAEKAAEKPVVGEHTARWASQQEASQNSLIER